jgi:cold shock CspA family protein
MNQPDSLSALQVGTVTRLNLDVGFGYVRDAAGENAYVFVVGQALTHTQVRRLSVGQRVQFRVSGQGQVKVLQSAPSE